MGRPRAVLPPGLEAEFRARTERGESAAVIKAALGLQPGISTLEEMQRAIRGRPGARGPKGSTPPSAHAAAPAAASDVPDAVPEGASLEQLNRWLKACEDGLAEAKQAKNLQAVASLAQKAAALMALRHRLTPIPKSDPNEHPDLKALAAQGRARLQKMADDLFAGKTVAGE